MKTSLLCAALIAAFAASAQAQNIERVKMTDNDLSCQQIYGEIGLMDSVIARASQPVAAPSGVQTDAGANAGGQVAGAVAQTAMAAAVAKGAGSFGGFGGFGSMGGGLGSMFGGIAQQVAQSAGAQQAATDAAAQQQAAASQQNQAIQGQQAQGRKEHLTGMFLSKGCKMSDIKK